MDFNNPFTKTTGYKPVFWTTKQDDTGLGQAAFRVPDANKQKALNQILEAGANSNKHTNWENDFIQKENFEFVRWIEDLTQSFLSMRSFRLLTLLAKNSLL